MEGPVVAFGSGSKIIDDGEIFIATFDQGEGAFSHGEGLCRQGLIGRAAGDEIVG